MNFSKNIDKIFQFICCTVTAIVVSILYILTLVIVPSITGSGLLTNIFTVLSFSSVYLLLEYKSATIFLFISIFICFFYNLQQIFIPLIVFLTLWFIFIFHTTKLFSNVKIDEEVLTKPFMGYLIIIVSVIVLFILLLSVFPGELVNKYLPKGTNTSYLVCTLLFFSAVYKQYTSLILFVGQPLDYDQKTFPFFKDALKFCVDTLVSVLMVYSVVLIICLRFMPIRNFLLKYHWIKNEKKTYYLTSISEVIFFVISMIITLLIMSLLYQILKFFFKSEWISNSKVESSLPQDNN